MLPLVSAAIVIALLLGGGYLFFFRNAEKIDTFSPITTRATRGEFSSQVLDQGEIQSSENIEIRCEAKARNGTLTVIRVVPEGSLVKEGDFLVQLDATGFEKELEQQRVVMANAETQRIQADTAFETAKKMLQEYEQGTFVAEQKAIENEKYDAESAIATANQNLKQAEENFAHSKTLAAKSYLTTQALQSSEFAVKNAQIQVQKAENMLALATKKLEVLEGITKERFMLQYESDIKAAEVTLKSQREAYEVEKGKMEEIQSMIDKCLIHVPKGVAGQVVYSKESSRGGNDWVLVEGGTVRENQVLIRLPDPNKMEVKALINEQSITQIAIGMPVQIRVDALNDRVLTGVVTKVNQYAEQNNWMSTSVRKYAAFVRIINPPDALKPGMNASVTIQSRYEEDALLIPIQAVYGVQDKQYCLVKTAGNKWETREISTAGENSQYVMVTGGLEVDEVLAMNPGAYKEYMDLPEVKRDNRIDIGEEGQLEIAKAQQRGAQLAGRPQPGAEAPAEGGAPAGGGRGGMRNFQIPESAAAFITERDLDSDGKLNKEEAGEQFSFFFDRIDTDGDGFLSGDELDTSFATMRQRRASEGSGFGQAGATSGAPSEEQQQGPAQ